jgi:hypothetical protein
MYLRIEVDRGASEPREEFTCAQSPVRIGRSPLNNLVLNSPWVSLHHGLLHFDRDSISYSDLGSTNGSSTKGPGGENKKVVPMVPVTILGPQGTAELQVGNVMLRITREHVGAAPSRSEKMRAQDGRSLGTRLTGNRSVVSPPGTERNIPPVQPPPGGWTPPQAAGYAAGATQYVSEGSVPPLDAPASGEPAAGEHAYNVGMTRMAEASDREAVRELRASLAAMPGAEAPAPAAPAWTPGSGAIGGARVDAYETAARIWARGPTGRPQLDGPNRIFAETLAAVADAFARGLVELNRGLREFGDGIGVRVMRAESALCRSQAGTDMLTYLLDPMADTRERLEELVDLFADLMIHEVALLNGVKAGVRKLLAELDPETFVADEGKGLFRFGGGSSLKKYSEHFARIAEDDGQAIVLGRAFAKAYASALGEDRDGGGGSRRKG